MSALSSRQNFSGNHSGFSTGWLSWTGASVALLGALASSVPSVVDCVLAGGVDAGTAALSAVVLVVAGLTAVASLMVWCGWLVF